MIRRINDYSYIDDDVFTKIANIVNDQKKLIKITDNINYAKKIAKEFRLNGYDTRIEENNKNYYIYVLPKHKIALLEAQSSGCFKKIASNQYKFIQANNPLGIHHYNFDDGTIWKVMTAKDGKEYLVKELDDKTDEIIRQPGEKAFSTMVITADNKNLKTLYKLCNLLYNNVNEEFINDLVKHTSLSLSTFLMDKLNRIIDSELSYLNITSPEYKNNIYEKVMLAIDNDQITNRQQISEIIKGGFNNE